MGPTVNNKTTDQFRRLHQPSLAGMPMMLVLHPDAKERISGLWACATVVHKDDTIGTEPLPEPSTCIPPGVAPETLKDDSVAAGYRKVSWALGIDPTKHRPAGEALARRTMGGRPLPQIHPLVDAYNLASAATLVPLGAYDRVHMKTPLTIRPAAVGERFHGIGRDDGSLDAGRMVYATADDQVAGVMLWRDAMATRVRTETTEALILAVGADPVHQDVGKRALQKAAALVRRVGYTWDGTLYSTSD